MYTCSVCSVHTHSLKAYARHCRVHANLPNWQMPCGEQKCNKTFKGYSALNSHITRDHSYLRQKTRVLRIGSNPGPIPNQISLVCPLNECGEECSDYTKLLIHLRAHLRQEDCIKCPYLTCEKKYSAQSSFNCHLSRVHRLARPSNGLQVQEGATGCDSPLTMSFEQNSHQPCPEPENHVSEQQDASMDDGGNESSDELEEDFDDLLTDYLALFYLKLQSKYLLPSATVQVIANGIAEINSMGVRRLKLKLLKNLQAEIEDSSRLEELVDDIFKDDLIDSLHAKGGKLSSEYLRLEYFKKSLNYIEPVQIRIGYSDQDKPCYYHYVPIEDTIKSLFNQSEVRRQYLESTAEPGVLQDISDGQRVRSCPIFESGGLQIILYQDSFEVVNPLGSGKKKHKILGVYFTLGNLHPHARSKIDPMQLAIVCKEKFVKTFGTQKLFQRLVDDLCNIEKSGVFIPALGKRVKGSLVAILGDNLGSHSISGLPENFSTACYQCRYCLIRKEDMQTKVHANLHRKRTPELYSAAVKELNINSEPHEGIKFDSVFNKLDHFHVCSPGLPPCLGHDLFEGVVQYDVPLYLNYFIKTKKWFSDEYFNKRIEEFRYKDFEINDKPAEWVGKSKRLKGHAVQNWCLLRLLPLYIGDKIQDYTDNVWQLLLLLTDIVNYVCAQKITLPQVCHLNVIIQEYLDMRRDIFKETPLRPKHHYVSHYPELIIQFGPLMRVCTLRFESKHTYFKRCIRMSQNFINVTHTMSNRHQLLQAYYSSGSLFGSEMEFQNACEFIPDVYSKDISNAVSSFLHSRDDNSEYYTFTKVLFRGINFKTGQFIVLHSCDGNNLMFGKIMLMLSKKTANCCNLLFVVQRHTSDLIVEKRLYQLHPQSPRSGPSVVCKGATDLLDLNPLPGHVVRGEVMVYLRHSVPYFV